MQPYGANPAAIQQWWFALPADKRAQLLTLDKKGLKLRLRECSCSLCYAAAVALVQDIAAGHAFENVEGWNALEVEDGEIVLKNSAEANPFSVFSQASERRGHRAQRKHHSAQCQYQCCPGGVCVNAYRRRLGRNMCDLHNARFSVVQLLNHAASMGDEALQGLLHMREEDFLAELDAQLRQTLRVCSECRSNVTRAFREVKLGHTECCGMCEGQPPTPYMLQLAEGVNLVVQNGCVSVVDSTEDQDGLKDVFTFAMDLEDEKMGEGGSDDQDEYGDHVRHAETPCAAREALVDAACLIVKNAVEGGLRKTVTAINTAQHVADIALCKMEEDVLVAFRELDAQKAQEELLLMLEADDAKAKGQKETKRQKKKEKKGKKCSSSLPGTTPSRAAAKGDEKGDRQSEDGHADGQTDGEVEGVEGASEDEEPVQDSCPMQLLERAVEQRAKEDMWQAQTAPKTKSSKALETPLGQLKQPHGHVEQKGVVPVRVAPPPAGPLKVPRAVPLPLPPQPAGDGALKQPRGALPVPRKAVPVPGPPQGPPGAPPRVARAEIPLRAHTHATGIVMPPQVAGRTDIRTHPTARAIAVPLPFSKSKYGTASPAERSMSPTPQNRAPPAPWAAAKTATLFGSAASSEASFTSSSFSLFSNGLNVEQQGVLQGVQPGSANLSRTASSEAAPDGEITEPASCYHLFGGDSRHQAFSFLNATTA